MGIRVAQRVPYGLPAAVRFHGDPLSDGTAVCLSRHSPLKGVRGLLRVFEVLASHVRIGARASSKEAAIRQVGELLVESGFVEAAYIDSIIEREKVANTYLGNGIAIPHGLPRDAGFIERTGIVILQFPDGVDWGGFGLAHLVVGIAAKSDEHLAVLARLSDLLVDGDRAKSLAIAQDPGQIAAALGTTSRSIAEPDLSTDYSGDREEARVGATHGLHVRLAKRFAAAARQYDSQVRVCCRERTADGKEITSLLRLGADHGDTVTIYAAGADAKEALRNLKNEIERPEDIKEQTAPSSHGWTPRHKTEAIRGIGASPGLATGRIHIHVPARAPLQATAKDPAHEKRKLHHAIVQSKNQLHHLYQRAVQKVGPSGAAIFLAHTELLDDTELVRAAEETIDAGKSAPYAWEHILEVHAESLERSENRFLTGRAIDLRDLKDRVLRNLDDDTSVDEQAQPFDEPTLLIASELTPSETITLDTSNIVGFCTAAGGPTSHSAILARSMSIPAIVGAGMRVLQQAEGAVAILDGDSGMLYLNPAVSDITSAEQAQQRIAEVHSREYGSRFVPAITTDATRVYVKANIGRTDDIGQALENGAEGVGLMRSEFLFLQRGEPPSEQEQYKAYRQMIEALGGLPLVLRTLDVGGDKSVPYIEMPHEANPFLGLRGIRLCLRNVELFRTQLRAACRASVHGPLKVMFPMIATVEEARSAMAIAEDISYHLGVPQIEMGCMIEVPSAVAMAAELASTMDFFSIGTNDLTQYALAMDRGNPLFAEHAAALHPAVLRMIDQVLRAAEAKGKPVSVCGGWAADPIGCQILVGLGVAELSMPPATIPEIKARIRSASMTALQESARQALRCEDAEEVRTLFGSAMSKK